MKGAALVAILSISTSGVAAGQARANRPAAQPSSQPSTQETERTAQAYEQFLRARALRDDDVSGAIAAYRRAMSLDPSSADIPADLADLYMNENRWTDAIAAAEQALKIAPANREAHRVLGLVYAQLVGAEGQRGSRATQQENLNNAILHLEQALQSPPSFADFTPRAVLARLYVAGRQYDKAIATLPDLVRQGWQEGANLLIEAYSGAGRSGEAVKWLEEAAPDNPALYGNLGEFYSRERRWADSASAYEQALRDSPRSVDLRIWMASSLLQTDNLADTVKARDALREAVSMRGTDERAMYLLSQAERRAGDHGAAEAVARRLITQNAKNPRGYVALAEVLEEQRQFQPLVDALSRAIPTFSNSNDGGVAAGMLLQHLGFAYQELGQYNKAVETFEHARRLAPNDPSIVLYLMQAHVAAKNYTQAVELARTVRPQRPGDLRFARVESIALRRSGKVDQGLAVLEEIIKIRAEDPDAVVALAEAYLDANRGVQATKLLQDAQTKFPDDTGITLQLGAALDKQKRYMESEAVLRKLIAKEPNNATALNYLGYMLAERGERLNESVDFLKRALAIDPSNGSYLDSIGWAYFKDGKLDLAFENLKRAADQLITNSVVQDHYGDVLFKLGRYDEAIVAWDRALSGDGDSIVRGTIDKKIRSARQKLPKR
jgi:tetratricopeptide (TPR) repeat protein